MATDELARRSFARYWRLIRRPSGLLRRIMLDRIATAAVNAVG